MNLGEMKALVHHATKNDVLLGVFPTLINQALRQIQQRRSFRNMKRTLQTLVGGGYSVGVLPPDFKEPQRGTHPLRVSDSTVDSNYRHAWKLISKQEASWINGRGLGYNVAYLDTTDGVNWSVNLTAPAASNIYCFLDSYVFSLDLTSDADTHYLITNYPQMVLEKTKSLAFALEDAEKNQRNLEISEMRFLEEFKVAAADDSSREVSGRNFRMGGS